jgi:hypothetical protein
MAVPLDGRLTTAGRAAWRTHNPVLLETERRADRELDAILDIFVGNDECRLKVRDRDDHVASHDSAIFLGYPISPEHDNQVHTVTSMRYNATYMHLTLSLIMLIHLLHILYNLKNERRRDTRNKPLCLYERISASFQYPSSHRVRYSTSNLDHQSYSDRNRDDLTFSKAGRMTPSSIAFPSTSGSIASCSCPLFCCCCCCSSLGALLTLFHTCTVRCGSFGS